MRKTFVLLAALLIASTAWGAYRDLNVTEDTILGTTAADTVTTNATLSFLAATSFPAGTAALPSINITGSLTSGFYEVLADSLGISIATNNIGTWDAASYQGALGQTTPAAADVTTFTTTGQSDLDPGTAADPTLVFTGSLTTGFYEVAADSPGVSIATANVGTWDAAGYQGDLGQTTPGLITGTDIDATGDITLGQDPGDLFMAYNRTEYIKFVDDFSIGNDADLAVRWDLTQLVGLGTNDETTTDGWNTLITAAAGGPDMESTRSNGLHLYRANSPRLEISADLTAVAAGQTFFFGFWAGAAEFAEIIMEPATSPNWLVRVDDTGGATTHDTGIAAGAGTPTKLEIWVDAAGAINAAIDDVDVACAGLDPMTANAHYVEWRILNVAVAAKTIAIDYYVQEQLKMAP